MQGEAVKREKEDVSHIQREEDGDKRYHIQLHGRRLQRERTFDGRAYP